MKLITGTFNGTGAAVYICCGFIPDAVRIQNLTTNTYPELYWNINNRVDGCVEGFYWKTGTTYRQITACTVAGGVAPYEGGDLMTSTNQTTTSYGEGVYLYKDTVGDYKQNSSYGYVSNPLTTWTLDTSANRTGHFNDDVPATVARIGAGSMIAIEELDTGIVKWANINVLTAGQGISADEVELSRVVKSGTILYASGKWDFIPVPLTYTTPAGFLMSDTNVNVNNAVCWFEAIAYND